MFEFPSASSKTIRVCLFALFVSLAGTRAAEGLTVLYAFKGVKNGDGGNPHSNLIADGAGIFTARPLTADEAAPGRLQVAGLCSGSHRPLSGAGHGPRSAL